MTAEKVNEQPVIFAYDNYRLFLRDTYQWRKAQKRAFSFRLFSRIAGFGSPNFLKRVMEGSRNLGSESIPKFCKGLGFNKAESDFFRHLVLFNQAQSLEERQKYARELMRSKVYRSLRPLAKMQYEYWTKWYHVAIRELVDLDDFQEKPDWLASQLIPRIRPEEAKSALEELEKLDIIKRNDQGQLKCTDNYISTGDQVINASVAQFHAEMIRKAGESLSTFSAQERQISSITVALSQEGMEKMKAMIDGFRKDLLSVANEDAGKEQVFQINFQLFPLTKKLERT